MAMAIATHMEEHPDHVDISCDARNAFNTWCRSRLWGPLLEKFPSMFALVKLMYGDDADVIFYEDGAGIERIINAVGSRQGCSLGSFLYCLAIHPYLQQLRAEFPDLLILAYCDDAHILGPPSRAIAAYKRWAEIYCNELQGELRDDKGVAFAPQHTKLDLIEQGMPDDMQHTSLGTRILGAPVGSEAFWVEYASTIVDEIARDFNVLGRVRNFQAQHIIASKSLVHRINHLLRNVPGGESTFHEIAARYDSCVLSVVRRICSSPVLPDVARRIAHLPAGMGGLGLRSWAGTADAAFVAAYANAAETLPVLLPTHAHFRDRLPTAQTLIDLLPTSPDSPTALAPSRLAFFAGRALARLNVRAPGLHEALRSRDDRSPSNLQHRLTGLTDSADLLAVKGVLETLDSEEGKEYPWRSAHFNSTCLDPHTFNTVPKDVGTTITDNRDFEIMYKRRLLLPIFKMSEKRMCPSCSVTSDKRARDSERRVLDPHGHHCLVCVNASSGERTRSWHDAIVKVLCDILRMAGFKVRCEVSNILVTGPLGLRADLVVCIPGESRQIVVDVRTADSCALQNIKRAAQFPRVAATLAEALKNKKWQDFVHAQGDIFIAFAVEAGGAIGEAALSLINMAACANGASAAEIAAFTTYALQRIHITTQLGVARTIRANAPIPTGARLLHLPGTIDLGAPVPRSRINQPLALDQPDQTTQQQPNSSLQPRTQAAPSAAGRSLSSPPQLAAILNPLPSPHNRTAHP